MTELAALLNGSVAEADVVVAPPGDLAGAERLRAFREGVPLGVNRRVAEARRGAAQIEKVAADVIVPVERVAALLDFWSDGLALRGLDGAVWGHVSDGNLHPNVIPRSADEYAAGREFVLAVGREATRLGGAPLAEHGVGRNLVKQQLLRELYGDEGIAQMHRVKQALDPGGTLAPGVLFPGR
jgi:D-lactate dehydrogenase (cytochrome)